MKHNLNVEGGLSNRGNTKTLFRSPRILGFNIIVTVLKTYRILQTKKGGKRKGGGGEGGSGLPLCSGIPAAVPGF